jgi:hypothetical protein
MHAFLKNKRPAELDETYLSRRDIEKRWNVSPNSVRRMVARGVLPPPLQFGPQIQRWAFSAVLAAERSFASSGPRKSGRAAAKVETTAAGAD